MCGIVGYIGDKEKKELLLNGLKELEYRGYDSAGIAVLKDDQIEYFKAVGKLENLSLQTQSFSSDGFGLGIAHTRWATHGKPTIANAHPHFGEFSFIIHNGIIENYLELKESLEQKGIKFLSQTDTEVVVHLFEENLKNTNEPLEAFKTTIKSLKGAYALLLITNKDKEHIYFAKNAVPLIIGTNDKNEIFFGSSDAPLIGHANKVCYLEDFQYGKAGLDEIVFFERNNQIKPNFITLSQDKSYAQKEGFRYFMEKEIYEQSRVVSDTLMGRVKKDGVFENELDKSLFENIDSITICACGTSYHASMVAKYLLEELSQIKCDIEFASEFRYRKAYLSQNTLFIVVSQSGETADTLEALKIAKKLNLKTLSICNVDNSSIVRLADFNILTRAGIEKGVASTKAFATQVVVFWMLSLYLAKLRNSISKNDLQAEIEALLEIPSVLVVENSLHERIHRLSKRYLHGHGFFFIGRHIFYPLALEGALKLKEISYLHAEGYPAGEMKHGPIALADNNLFTIALMPQSILYEKTKSNVEELSARDATILAISPKEFHLADDFIKTKDYKHKLKEFFAMMIITQILALEIAIRLENDVDMPRNLAKSVTVE